MHYQFYNIICLLKISSVNSLFLIYNLCLHNSYGHPYYLLQRKGEFCSIYSSKLSLLFKMVLSYIRPQVLKKTLGLFSFLCLLHSLYILHSTSGNHILGKKKKTFLPFFFSFHLPLFFFSGKTNSVFTSK